MELTADMIVPSNPVSPEQAHTTRAERTNWMPRRESADGPGSAARARRSATARSSSPSPGATSRCFTDALSRSSLEWTGEVPSVAWVLMSARESVGIRLAHQLRLSL